ncbi:E3 ubiquitin-protein ligase LRSAM1-like isoform X2 [Prorops nasuta]|uniref:E3 ubiquitin-protein ligase LRSAM1-like isoform X2 n=1 Tax=Prorops nasuta TaxID=863751 RepID=UPI0034CD5458
MTLLSYISTEISQLFLPTMSLQKEHQYNSNVNYKARLEHKLYLARENPEPIFDLSECALKQVPSGIYSLCKVFRKETLCMHSNKLSSLSGGGALNDLSMLTILDIHSNKFTKLPPEIMHLESLEELYLHNNNLIKLPNELTYLSKLSILDVSKNNLKQLPEDIGKLEKLTKLDISYNTSLKKLPTSLGYLQDLTILNIKGLQLLYPPEDILNGGSLAIIEYLATESGIDYLPKTINTKEINSNNKDALYENASSNLQATLQKLEKIKEHKHNALLEVERNIKKQQKYEVEVQFTLKAHRKRLLEDLAKQQMHMENKLEKFQQERDGYRTRLLSYIFNVEKDADNVIKELLRNNDEERQNQIAFVEREKQEEVQILSIYHTEQFMLRTQDTLVAMEKLLEEEFKKSKQLAEYTKFRDDAAQSLLSLEIVNNCHLSRILQDQEKNRKDLIKSLEQDEALQKAAVAALLEGSDARSWSIVQQVNLVQSQLATLTSIELERKKLQLTQTLNEVMEKRIMLSEILVSLLKQQQDRRDQLLVAINHIEEQRDIKNSQFWLYQYQSLMEARPQGMLEMLEPTLVRHIAIVGALHCLPYLSNLPQMLQELTEQQLTIIGVDNVNDRRAIMLAVENYLSEAKLNNTEILEPSAPSETAGARLSPDDCENISSVLSPQTYASCSTTTSLNNPQCITAAECIVCLDLLCEIIFIPCGHMCCCSICASKITTECPMCRTNIDRKIQVIQP